MGARPLRRAIQRYIEDPLADEVLKAGPEAIISGTTVLVSRDEAGDATDQPLKLELIAPEKPAKSDTDDKQPVVVGAKGSEEEEPTEDPSGEESPDSAAEASE